MQGLDTKASGFRADASPTTARRRLGLLRRGSTGSSPRSEPRERPRLGERGRRAHVSRGWHEAPACLRRRARLF